MRVAQAGAVGQQDALDRLARLAHAFQRSATWDRPFDYSRLAWRPTEETLSVEASPIVSAAEHRAAERAEQGQDRPDDKQKNSDSPQDRAMDQNTHNQ